jgi:ribosomal protein L21E
MIKRKGSKLHGKVRLSQYFQEFKEGDKVAIVREHSLNPAFPKRIQGKTGLIAGMRGRACIVVINDGNAKKIHIIAPAHLKRLK